jgi:hypothetical protein
LKKILLSIVVPCYNEAKFLEKTILKGDSSKKILKALSNNTFWNMSLQKIFSKY